MSGFVHLHNHMQGSYSDSALTVRGALDKVCELGMDTFAITDHGEMAMVRTFAREASGRGIRPIVGMEAYFVEDARENIRRRVNFRHHLLLLAGNKTGYRNLIRIASRSWDENCLMQKLGLVDWRLLEEHGEGLIVLSGCLAGPIGWSYLQDHPEDADRFYGRFAEMFGERFYIEIYRHNLPEETKAAAGLEQIARRYNHPVVLTNDCHYLEQKDWVLHDVLIKTRFGKPTDFALPQHEYHIKSPAEMRGLGFPEEYSDATLRIAEMIELTAGEILAPSTEIPGETEYAFIGSSAPIGWTSAVEKAAGVQKLTRREQERAKSLSRDELEREYPQLAEIAGKIEALPQMPYPDFTQVAAAPSLHATVPLRRFEEALFTMWNRDEVVAAGASVLPLSEVPQMHSLARAGEAYREGLRAYKRRQHDKAREAFRRALSARPGFVNARYQLGLVEYYQNHFSEALEHFRAVLAEAPEFERLPYLRSYTGWCELKLGLFPEALENFNASYAEKSIPGSLLGSGLALEAAGRRAEARQKLLEFVEVAPDHSKIGVAQNALERLSGA